MMELGEFKELVDGLPYGVYIVKPDRTIIYWNREAEEITGYRAEDMIGRQCPDSGLHHMNDYGAPLCKTYCPLIRTFDDQKKIGEKLVFTHKNGYLVAIDAHFIPLKDRNGQVTAVAEVFDMLRTMEQETEIVKNLYKMAYHDALTNLPNRPYLESIIRLRFSEFHRLHYPFAVLFADIDHFHEFNEKYGHGAGDHMLKEFASVLTQGSRRGDVIGRWGGEEFIGIYPIKKNSDTISIGRRFRSMVNSIQIREGNKDLSITMSIGITAARDGDTVNSIIARADSYMFQAKKKGRNTVVTDDSLESTGG